ncbi:Hypothetical protein PHPALM_19505, partial [Phytophthora palmivora]
MNKTQDITQHPTKKQKLNDIFREKLSSDDTEFGSLTDTFSSQEDTTKSRRLSSPDSLPYFEEATPSNVTTSMQNKLHERKVAMKIKDCVHGFMTFEPVCMRIIDTLQFQRLRNLHQLGPASYVYIGATHSRFEHCLG